jgi:cold shock CspA family protein
MPYGTILNIRTYDGTGTIKREGEAPIRFHKASLLGGAEFNKDLENQKVSYVVVNGYEAENVRPTIPATGDR